MGTGRCFFLSVSSITTQIWAHEPMLTVNLGYMHWILQNIGSRKHMHRSTKKHKNLPFGFYTIKPTPCSAFIKSRCITENPPSQHCLQKGHDLWEVSIWSWKELILLTTMPYFKLRFSRWACKDFKNLKFKDFTAYVFVLILLTQASCWLQSRLQLFVWFSFRVLTGPKWLLSLATST